MKSFNELLIERIKSYFQKNYGVDISDETAEEYLHSLAGMFAVFAESEGGKPPPDPLERTGGGDHPAV
jgi:hypothetical protein